MASICRYVEKFRKNSDSSMVPNFRQRQVFTSEQEEMIKDYLLDCSLRFHGLSRSDARKFVYDLAVDNDVEVPDSWVVNRRSGEKWLSGFMSRHPSLSLRKPEATSIARSAAFNKQNVQFFFNELGKAYKETKVNGSRIYNLDESGFTTVQSIGKVISPTGKKQIGQIVSRERGELTTCVGIVNAMGNKLPPVLIFPRKRLNEALLHGCPEGTLGLTNPDTGSAWMTGDLFEKVIEHIVKHAKPSKQDPIVLVMDNHVSHCGYGILKMAKENCIQIVTLPPSPHITQNSASRQNNIWPDDKAFQYSSKCLDANKPRRMHYHLSDRQIYC